MPNHNTLQDKTHLTPTSLRITHARSAIMHPPPTGGAAAFFSPLSPCLETSSPSPSHPPPSLMARGYTIRACTCRDSSLVVELLHDVFEVLRLHRHHLGGPGLVLWFGFGGVVLIVLWGVRGKFVFGGRIRRLACLASTTNLSPPSPTTHTNKN